MRFTSPKSLKKLASGEEFSELSSGLHQSVYIASPPKVAQLHFRKSATSISSSSNPNFIEESFKTPPAFHRILPNSLRNIQYHDNSQVKKGNEQQQRMDTGTARLNSVEDRRDHIKNTPNLTPQKTGGMMQEQKEDDKENNKFKKNPGHTLSTTAYNYAYLAMKKIDGPRVKSEGTFSPNKIHGTSELEPKCYPDEASNEPNELSPISSPLMNSSLNPTMKKISDMRFSEVVAYREKAGKGEMNVNDDGNFNRYKPNRIKVKPK